MGMRLSSPAKLLASLALCLLVEGLNGLATQSGVGTWFQGLRKPAFNPPGWLFLPVWSLLFLLMAVALWRVWRLPASAGRRAALLRFGAQLALNPLWSAIFFGLQWPAGALALIVVLWAAILLAVRAFWRLDRVAGGLLLPYLAWVGFAAVLNAALVRLNG